MEKLTNCVITHTDSNSNRRCNMRTRKMNNKGFTLVEVIVVAVIVAILALVGIQLYRGYVQDARQGTVENLTASAATFLQSEYNSGADTTVIKGLSEVKYWQPRGVDEPSFTVPAGIIVTIGSNNVKGTDTTDITITHTAAWKN
jgi:prepilin-type N-terminal cleavage/methylation domain-containing protein